MKVHLDNCCLQRPLDDKRLVRVQLEAEAVLAILTLYEAQKISLVSSEVLEFELAQNPDQQRKVYIEQILSGAALKVVVNDAIASRAKEL